MVEPMRAPDVAGYLCCKGKAFWIFAEDENGVVATEAEGLGQTGPDRVGVHPRKGLDLAKGRWWVLLVSSIEEVHHASRSQRNSMRSTISSELSTALIILSFRMRPPIGSLF